MKLVLAVAAFIALGVAAISGASAADANPFVGSWTLNLTRSTYVPGSAPASSVRKTEDLGSGKFRTTIDSVATDGTATHTQAASYAFDGKDYPVTGNPTFDVVAVKQVDEHTVEVTGKKAGKVAVVYKVQVSVDGKTLTQTTPGATPEAKPTVAVYDKQ